MNTGASSSFEVKGIGKSSSKWFEAKKTSSGTYALTAAGAKALKASNEKAAAGGGGGGDGGGGGGGC